MANSWEVVTALPMVMTRAVMTGLQSVGVKAGMWAAIKADMWVAL